jgi:hypothetical protein
VHEHRRPGRSEDRDDAGGKRKASYEHCVRHNDHTQTALSDGSPIADPMPEKAGRGIAEVGSPTHRVVGAFQTPAIARRWRIPQAIRAPAPPDGCVA